MQFTTGKSFGKFYLLMVIQF